jgi:predicted HicB family RNase H-like nuclease
MKCLEYIGYLGSFEMDMSDNILHGKLLHIKDLVTYEGASPKELEEQFKLAVEDYIASCEADGIEPDKPFKGSFNIRIRPELHRELARSARESGKSLNDYVGCVLIEHRSLQKVVRGKDSELLTWIQSSFPLHDKAGFVPLVHIQTGHVQGARAPKPLSVREIPSGRGDSSIYYASVSEKTSRRRMQ